MYTCPCHGIDAFRCSVVKSVSCVVSIDSRSTSKQKAHIKLIEVNDAIDGIHREHSSDSRSFECQDFAKKKIFAIDRHLAESLQGLSPHTRFKSAALRPDAPRHQAARPQRVGDASM